MDMSNTELRLYQAWCRQYLGRGRDYGPRSVNATMADALDAGLSEAEVHRVMDAAAESTSEQRGREYRRHRVAATRATARGGLR